MREASLANSDNYYNCEKEGKYEFYTTKTKIFLCFHGCDLDVNSKHFDDQALMYTKGIFKDVFYYREDVEMNAERTYNPGK